MAAQDTQEKPLDKATTINREASVGEGKDNGAIVDSGVVEKEPVKSKVCQLYRSTVRCEIYNHTRAKTTIIGSIWSVETSLTGL